MWIHGGARGRCWRMMFAKSIRWQRAGSVHADEHSKVTVSGIGGTESA